MRFLIDLLDFQRPESEGEKLHLFDAHDKFPAVPALFSIGLPAVPKLIAKLQDAQTTEKVRSNAIRTIFTIYRENPVQAITVLMDAAHAAKTQDQAVRLGFQGRESEPAHRRKSVRRMISLCSMGDAIPPSLTQLAI